MYAQHSFAFLSFLYQNVNSAYLSGEVIGDFCPLLMYFKIFLIVLLTLNIY